MKVVADGRAERFYKRKFQVKDSTPVDILGADKVLDTPDVLLIDSSTSERGIEMYASATFPGAPSVLVEDYYTASHGFLQRLKERHLPYPRKICVMDRAAKELIVKHFPELEERIEVTGQPAFDRFAAEDTERMKTEVREGIGFGARREAHCIYGAQGELELLEKMANELKKVKVKYRLALGIHPRYSTKELQQRYRKSLEMRA